MIGSIGRRLDVQDDIAQHIGERRAELRLSVQFEDALVFIRESEFPFRANHAQRGDAPNLALA